MAVAENIPIIAARKMPDPARPPVRSAFGVTALRGKPAMLVESGQQGILNMAEVETHLIGLRNVLIHLGMLPGQVVNTVKRLFSEEAHGNPQRTNRHVVSGRQDHRLGESRSGGRSHSGLLRQSAGRGQGGV